LGFLLSPHIYFGKSGILCFFLLSLPVEFGSGISSGIKLFKPSLNLSCGGLVRGLVLAKNYFYKYITLN
jgi:hypothetical protein